MASGLYQALRVRRLPSGASVYYDWGEWEPHCVRGVSAGNSDDEAAAAFGQVIALPTYFHAGGDLLEIDRHLSVARGGWILESLLDSEASWIDHPELAEGEERRRELQRAIDESWDEGDADDEQLDHAQAVLDATPGWFLRLGDSELRRVASYVVPGDDHVPRLRHKLHPWTTPTGEMLLNPADRANLQHIVAAYLLAR